MPIFSSRSFPSILVRLIGASLILLSLTSLSSCKKKTVNAARIGFLSQIGMTEEDVKQWTSDVATAEGKKVPYTNPNTLIQFDSLDTMIMALKSGSIDRFSIGYETARYVASHDEDFELIDKHHEAVMGYSIASTENHREFIDSVNQAIDSMKNDGTLDALKEKYITNASENLETVELPSIPNAPVMNIAITGDLPPLDLILPDGTPAGFNTAFLAEVSKRINVNFNLVNISSGGRSLALSSNLVDALFRTMDTFDSDGNSLGFPMERTENMAVSKPYFQERRAAVKRAGK